MDYFCEVWMLDAGYWMRDLQKIGEGLLLRNRKSEIVISIVNRKS
jgi:hypothetical protein